MTTREQKQTALPNDSLLDTTEYLGKDRDELREIISERDAEIDRLKQEATEHDASFDLRWQADQRAIKRWQEAHPGNDLTWPDHADMVVWLLEEHARYRSSHEVLRIENDALKQKLIAAQQLAVRQANELRAFRRANDLLKAQMDAMEECIGVEEGKTFEERAEELIVTEVNHENLRAARPPSLSHTWVIEARELFRQTTFDDGAISMAEWERRRDALLAVSAQPSSVGPLTLDTDRQVFFYEQDHYYLSNFAAFGIVMGGLWFRTSEHAYHFCKFPDFPALQAAIRSAPSAHDAFKLAEREEGSRREDWDNVKIGIMRQILHRKVAQHEYVRRKLLATGDRELIENSWRDDYWGWGPNRDGQNMLGKLWMEIRAEIRTAAETTPGDTAHGEAATDWPRDANGSPVRATSTCTKGELKGGSDHAIGCPLRSDPPRHELNRASAQSQMPAEMRKRLGPSAEAPDWDDSQDLIDRDRE